MQHFLILLFILLTGNGFSQKVIDVGKNLPSTSSLLYTINGEPINNAKYVRVVDGSPFFIEAWTRGKITLSEGRVYDNIMLRLDLIDNTLQYKSPAGEELIATTPVKNISFMEIVSGKELQFDNSAFIKTTGKIETGWYQILDTGLVTLYKRHIKLITENKPYGSATYEQTISNTGRYYIFKNSLLLQISKLKQLPDMLQDKKSELLQYISSNNLTGRGDADYIALIGFYNSMVKK